MLGTAKEWVDDLFDLFVSIAKLNLSPEVIGILCCLAIFSPDHGYQKHLQKGLRTLTIVERIQIIQQPSEPI